MNRLDWSLIVTDDELRMMYRTKSLAQMEKLLGVSSKTIGQKLRSLGVELRPSWNLRGVRGRLTEKEVTGTET